MSVHVPRDLDNCQVISSSDDGSTVAASGRTTRPFLRHHDEDHRRLHGLRRLRLPGAAGQWPDGWRPPVCGDNCQLSGSASTWVRRQCAALRGPCCTSSWHVPRHLGILSPAGVTGREGRQSLRHWCTEKLYSISIGSETVHGTSADARHRSKAEWAVEEVRNATDWRTRHYRRNSFLFLTKISVLEWWSRRLCFAFVQWTGSVYFHLPWT